MIVEIGWSFWINLLALLPTIASAIYVEKYVTKFWPGFWNLFALLIAGLFLTFTPPVVPPWVSIGLSFGNVLIPFGLFLIAYSLIGLFLGFKIEPEVIRKLGKGAITTGILFISLISQTFFITEGWILILTAIAISAMLYFISQYT